VPNATDMIPLYINNFSLDFGIADLQFPPTIEYVACGLYKMTNAELLNTALQFKFKAADDPNHPSLGFVDDYSLTFGKCPSQLALDMSLPVVRTNITNNILVQSPAPVDTESGNCPGYKGTSEDFLPDANGYIPVTIQPHAGDGWLSATETYGVFSISLTAYKRVTNGYNSGLEGPYVSNPSFSIIRK
jgi:hypothetical protein